MYRKLSEDVIIIQDVSTNIDTLGGGVFMVQWSQDLGYHFVRQPSMSLPEKVYGHNHNITDKIFKTFEANVGKTTGVMLQGAKGTGKTLTSIEVCLRANAKEMPVILIQSEFFGSDFNDFLSKVQEPAVVFIDEFEKVYKRQEAIDSTLMLLDGAIKTTKLFLLTSNQDLALNERMEFLLNRPSRIHYVFEYGSVDDSVIEEYLDDHLKFDVYRSDIKALKRAYRLFTIDMLKAIVTEINRFGNEEGNPKVSTIIRDVNVKTDRTISSYMYEKFLHIGDQKFELTQFLPENDYHQVSAWSLEQQIEDGGHSTLNLYIPEALVPLDVLKDAIDSTTQSIEFSEGIKGRGAQGAACQNVLTRVIQEAKNLHEEIKDEGLSKLLHEGLTEDQRETFIQQHHMGLPMANRIQLRWWDHYQELGEITYEQDEKTRSIFVLFGDGKIRIEFKPIINQAKKESRFII